MHNHNEEINSWAYRDILLNCILGLVMMMGILVLLISIKQQMESAAETKAPGNLIVSIVWPPEDNDVDLWLYGPGEPVPVGFSNKGGRLFNLLRDDLGKGTDATPLNYESSYSRGVVPGTYYVNVKCWRCPILPVKVDVEIGLNKDAGDPKQKSGTKTILTTSVELVRDRQEVTVVSFRMDADGNIDPESMNNVFKPLADAWKQ